MNYLFQTPRWWKSSIEATAVVKVNCEGATSERLSASEAAYGYGDGCPFATMDTFLPRA